MEKNFNAMDDSFFLLSHHLSPVFTSDNTVIAIIEKVNYENCVNYCWDLHLFNSSPSNYNLQYPIITFLLSVMKLNLNRAISCPRGVEMDHHFSKTFLIKTLHCICIHLLDVNSIVVTFEQHKRWLWRSEWTHPERSDQSKLPSIVPPTTVFKQAHLAYNNKQNTICSGWTSFNRPQMHNWL